MGRKPEENLPWTDENQIRLQLICCNLKQWREILGLKEIRKERKNNK